MQASQPRPHGCFVGLGDRLEQREGYVLADDRSGLEQALVSIREPVDARRQHRLNRGRELDGRDRLRQPICAPLTIQRARLHQRPDGLLQEKRVPALDEELLEGREARILAEDRVQGLLPLDRQGVEVQLAVVGLAGPGMLVLGAMAREQQHARRCQSLGQRRRARPVSRCRSSQVLEDEEQRLLPRLPQQRHASPRRAYATGAATGRGLATRRRPRARRARRGGQGAWVRARDPGEQRADDVLPGNAQVVSSVLNQRSRF